MKLDLNFELNDLAGQPIKDANAGKVIANALVGESKGDPLKYWDLATKLYNGNELDLDASDTETLKNFIKNSESFTVLLKSQVLLKFK